VGQTEAPVIESDCGYAGQLNDWIVAGWPGLAAGSGGFESFRWEEVNVTLTTHSPAGNKWNAGWAEPLLSDRSRVELLHYGPNSVYLNKNYFPRAWIVHSVNEVGVGDVEGVKKMLADFEFDPKDVAIIEGVLPEPLQSPMNSEAVVDFEVYEPSYSRLDVALSSPGMLVVSDTYNPGWRVKAGRLHALIIFSISWHVNDHIYHSYGIK
jgi:hypothetical protein